MKVRILRFLNTVVSAASQFLQWVNYLINLVDSKTSDLVINSPPPPVMSIVANVPLFK